MKTFFPLIFIFFVFSCSTIENNVQHNKRLKKYRYYKYNREIIKKADIELTFKKNVPILIYASNSNFQKVNFKININFPDKIIDIVSLKLNGYRLIRGYKKRGIDGYYFFKEDNKNGISIFLPVILKEKREIIFNMMLIDNKRNIIKVKRKLILKPI